MQIDHIEKALRDAVKNESTHLHACTQAHTQHKQLGFLSVLRQMVNQHYDRCSDYLADI